MLFRCRPLRQVGTSRLLRFVCATSQHRSCYAYPFLTAFRFLAQQHTPLKNKFTAPPNVGSGRPTNEANPFKSWEHMSHTWLILMCVGCLCAGMLAGQLAEVDESQLKPKFSQKAVLEAAAKQLEFRPDLAATSIRVAFVLAARRAGFAADTVDESCAIAAGLADLAGVLNYLHTTFHGSLEDMVSLMAIASVRFLNGPHEKLIEEWRWGRNDTEEVQDRRVPSDKGMTSFSVPTILRGLGDLSVEESVALMACHSVGEFHPHVSGIDDATHIGKRFTLNNAYYRFLLDHEKKFKPLDVNRTEDNKDVAVLPTRMVYTYVTSGEKRRQCVINAAEVDVMLNEKTWRAIVERFAKDEAAWELAFQSAFQKMLEGGFKRLRTYSHSDAETAAS